MSDVTHPKLTAEEIDDLAATLRACLPDDSCNSQLGLLIYKEVLYQRKLLELQRKMIDELAEMTIAAVTCHETVTDIEAQKAELIDKLRTKYVS